MKKRCGKCKWWERVSAQNRTGKCKKAIHITGRGTFNKSVGIIVSTTTEGVDLSREKDGGVFTPKDFGCRKWREKK